MKLCPHRATRGRPVRRFSSKPAPIPLGEERRRMDGVVSKPTLSQLTAASFRIGCLGFGGPAGQIALMHRVFVEEKRWISEDRYLHALNYCMLLPGPEAQQLATYVGWLLHGVRGGVIAGALFV